MFCHKNLLRLAVRGNVQYIRTYGRHQYTHGSTVSSVIFIMFAVMMSGWSGSYTDDKNKIKL